MFSKIFSLDTTNLPREVINVINKRLIKELELTVELLNVLVKYRNHLLNHKCYVEGNDEEIKNLENDYYKIVKDNNLLINDEVDLDSLDVTEFLNLQFDVEDNENQKSKSNDKNETANNNNNNNINIQLESDYEGDSLEDRNVCIWPGCGYRADRRSTLQDHINTHTGAKPHKCNINNCERAFGNRKTLRFHIRTIHQAKTKVFLCNYENCGKIFKSKQYLTKHKIKHTDMFSCKNQGCSFRGSSSIELEKHFRIHTGEELPKPFECTWKDCNKKYAYSYSLKEHLATHIGVRKYKCSWPGCDKDFISKQCLRIHQAGHEGKKDKKCSWPGCDYRASQTSQISLHTKYVHEPYINRNYSCTWAGCTSKFVTSSQLKLHIRTHSGEKPIQCEWPGCEMRFAERTNMLKHMKIHRKIN